MHLLFRFNLHHSLMVFHVLVTERLSFTDCALLVSYMKKCRWKIFYNGKN